MHVLAYKDSNECDQEAGMLCDGFKDMKMYYKNAELFQTIMQKNLLETWGLVSRRGQRGNPLANGQHSSLGS